MKIAIHQPNYLPWIGYFDKMDQVDTFVILDTANHSKSGYINRTKIKTPQGSLVLTVPLKQKEKPINELEIENNVNWPTRHWKAIEANYKKCPYWADYKDGFEKIYSDKWDKIASLNIALIKHLAMLLTITTKIVVESDFQLDFGHNNARNVNIVSHLGGDIYLSGIGARVYNDESAFHDRHIKLIYQDFKHPEYPQRFRNFHYNLSILDMLFNCGPDTMEIIRQQRR